MRKLERRIFLRGLGGAVVAAPVLASLGPRRAGASSDPGPAKRTIVMFTHYGCITNRWFPAKIEGDLEASDLTPTTLAPLAPFARKLLLPRGLRGMNEWSGSNTGAGHGVGQGNDMHTQEVASALTCQPVSPNSDDPFGFDSELRLAQPIGPSLDHVIAQQLSPRGVPLLLNTAGQTREGAGTALSYSGPQEIFEARTAREAFSALSGVLGAGEVTPDSWELSKGKLLADIVKTDLETLRRMDMSRDDQRKLDAWLELANEVTRLVASPRCNPDTARRLGADRDAATRIEGDDAVTRRISDAMDNADLYSAIAVLTACCDQNPVIVLKYPGSFVFQGLGITTDSDLLAHRLLDASIRGTCAPHVIEDVLALDAYQAQKFANLLQMLDSVADGDGTLLDSSVVVWTSECSDGCARNLNNLPIVQAGSGGGYFKTGKIIDLDRGSGATAEDLRGRSLAICVEGATDQVDGLTKATGTDPRFANRPVNK